MRISDWSSDVCSSDLSTLTSRQRRSKARFAALAPLIRPPGTFSREREKGWLRYSAPILLIGATLLPPPIPDPTPPPGSSLTRPPTRPHSPGHPLPPEPFPFALYPTLEASPLALVVVRPLGRLAGQAAHPFPALARAQPHPPLPPA